MQKCTTATASNDLTANYYGFATVMLIAFAIYMMLATMAMANSPMGQVLCDIVRMITQGNLGKGLATLGIIVVGVGASIGKVSWGLAMTVAVGIAVTIRADAVLTAMNIGGGSC